MFTENEAENILRKEGYQNIYVWQDGSNAYYATHTHPTDSVHIVLLGEITIVADGEVNSLAAGDRIDVPANVEHSAQIGPRGCTYMVGEK